MKNHCYHLLLLLFISLSINQLQAQEEDYESYQTIGVFIAINDYSGNIWQSLNNPVLDANAIKTLLTEKYYFDELISVYDEKATRENIIDTLDQIVSNLGKNDRLLVYFSGHGIEIGEEGYWVPYDAMNEDRSQLIPNSEIKNTLAKSPCKHALLMVDACFSGSIFKSSNMYFRNDGSNNYYDKIGNVSSRQAITAGGLEPVMDGSGENSVFAKYVLKFLDKNEQVNLAASELYELIKYPIASNSPNTPMFGHIQDAGHEGGQFIFELITEEEETVTKIVKADEVPESEKVVVKDCSHLKVEIEEGEKIIFNKDDRRLHAISSDPDVSYQWYEGLTPLKYDSPIFEVNKSSEYTIVITDKFNCSSAATIDVKIVYNDAFVNIRQGERIKFTYKGVLDATTNMEGLGVEWRFNNFIVGNELSLPVTESGTYTINIKDSEGKTIATATSEVIIESRTYIVNVGDNLERLARKFYNDETKKSLIIKANPTITENNGALRVGETLLIPSDINEVAAVNQLKVGSVNDLIPLSAPGIYKNGIVTDIAIQVFNEMNVNTSMEFSSMNKVKSGVYNGVYGVALPLAKTPFDELSLYFSEPLYKLLNVFFVKKDAEIEFTKNKDLKGKKIAVAKGVNIIELNAIAGKYIEIVPALTLEIAFQMLEEGKVDMVASPQLVGLLTLKNMTTLGMENFDILNKEISTEELYLVISKNHPNAEEIIQNFNKTFNSMKGNGIIEEIINEHLDKYQKP